MKILGSSLEISPAEQVVAMGTITGARALHLGRQIGSLEAGKKADLIVVDTSVPRDTALQRLRADCVCTERIGCEDDDHRRTHGCGGSEHAHSG